ncbi:hypothetical protein PHYSODRAFT_438715, partial [Phytophthora sojae]
MRSPDAAFIRARAKAPLPDLLALHLSDSDIECIKHLELCKSLRSLYSDSNQIKDIEGIIELRKLWRIDFNGNLLKNLHPLASFRALGFVHLERNRISFEDLVCIRDVHLLEVRLVGNAALFKDNTVDEYRKKVVALLPNAWVLDGHFISTAERRQAVEEYDEFVTALLELSKRSVAKGSKFGSASDVWVESEATANNSVELNCSANLIDIAHKISPPEELPDLRRLQAVVSFHNAESAIHNTHSHFAPSRHAPNARLMPKIWMDEILALPRRTRLEVIVLIATFLEFRYPQVLLSEALTIRQLDSPHFPSDASRDTANLPTYAMVALIALARQFSPATQQFQDESEMLAAIPPLFETLLSSKGATTNAVDDSKLQATALRCKREAVIREMMPLIRAAESAPATSRKPKPGDWVEVYLKQFVRIQFLSADGLFVVGALPTDASRTITISAEQMSRISSTVWR